VVTLFLDALNLCPHYAAASIVVVAAAVVVMGTMTMMNGYNC